MFDDDDARGDASEPARLRRRVRRPRRSRSTRRSARFRPLLRDIVPVAQNLSAPRDRPARASSARSAQRRARSSRPVGRDAGRAVRQPRHDVRARCARSRGPFIQESITEGPATLDAGDPRLPASSARSCANTEACSASCSRARARCATRRRTSRTRSRSARRRCAAPPPFNQPARAAARRARRRSPTTRWSPRGLKRLTDDGRDAQARRSTYLAPAQTHVQLRRRLFRNVASLLSRGRHERHLAAVHHRRRRRRARTTRAARRPAPANGPTGRQPPARQPVPEHGVAGPAARSARPATSRYTAGKTVIGNVPGNQSAHDGEATP